MMTFLYYLQTALIYQKRGHWNLLPAHCVNCNAVLVNTKSMSFLLAASAARRAIVMPTVESVEFVADYI